VAGDFDLRLAQDLLDVAYAERAPQKKVRDAKASPVTQALVDLDQLHAGSYTRKSKYAGSKISEDELALTFAAGRSGEIEKQGFGGL
jgi:hypothetical protein